MLIKCMILCSFMYISVSGMRRPDEVIDRVRFKVDKPIRSDLVTYLRALHYIVNFYTYDHNDIDLNFEFGIFLSNVHLKSVLRYKGHRLPNSISENINLLIQDIDKLIAFFNGMVQRDNNPADQLHKILISLYNNQTVWMSQIQKFDTFQFKIPKMYSLEALQKNYSDFETYKNNLADVINIKPSPKHSDICVISLARNPVHVTNELTQCKIPDDCIEMLYNGTDFGYALTHRILLLIAARFGRLCSLISPEKDKKVIENLCGFAYNEAEYISRNNYEVADLLMEQIIFCSLNGHLEFIRRSWLVNILNFQTAEGCFSDKPNAHERVNSMRDFKQPIWQLDRQGDHYIMGGRCNTHISTVAAATLATAVRYILESYF